jgi:hypothetical protein
VRSAFVHRLVLQPNADFDQRAPGGAVTRELCGSWDHEGECLLPHHSATRADRGRQELRVVFAVEPSSEAVVRQRIADAVGAGSLVGPDGRTSRWELLQQSPDELTDAERDMAGEWVTSFK